MSHLPPALSMKPMSIHCRGRIHFGYLSLSHCHTCFKEKTHTQLYIIIYIYVQMYTHTPTHTYYIYIYQPGIRRINHTKPYIKLMTHKPCWLGKSQQLPEAHHGPPLKSSYFEQNLGRFPDRGTRGKHYATPLRQKYC